MVAVGTWVWRDGARLTPAILANLDRLDADFFAVWGVRILASSGIRTDAEQEAIFRQRYVPVSQVNGRRVYDYRWWNGVQWARISSAGTVAVPGSSNHQLGGGRRGAVDVRDSGADAGILTAGSPRARWLVANAPRFGFSTDEGYSVGEPWHLRYLWDPWADAPAPASNGASPFTAPPPISEETDMLTIIWNGHWFTFGEEKVLYHDNYSLAKTAAFANNPSDRRGGFKLDDEGMTSVCQSRGVPWYAVDACMHRKAYGLDGSVGGTFWSRTIEQKIDVANLGRDLAASFDELQKRAEAVAPLEKV